MKSVIENGWILHFIITFFDWICFLMKLDELLNESELWGIVTFYRKCCELALEVLFCVRFTQLNQQRVFFVCKVVSGRFCLRPVSIATIAAKSAARLLIWSNHFCSLLIHSHCTSRMNRNLKDIFAFLKPKSWFYVRLFLNADRS